MQPPFSQPNGFKIQASCCLFVLIVHHSLLQNGMDESVQSLSQCPTLCDPRDCSTPGFPVHHQLPELAHTHVHRVSDAIQPSHPLSSPSPPAFNLSQHQSFPMSQLFASGGQSIGASNSGEFEENWLHSIKEISPLNSPL